jgi:hypothetical protein
MKRAHLAAVALATGLGVLSGCNGLPGFRLLHRNRDACCSDGVPIDTSAGMPMPGPGLGDFGPPPPMPPPGVTGAPLLPAPTIAPGGTAPGQVPRLVPQPEQAQPKPYVPETK